MRRNRSYDDYDDDPPRSEVPFPRGVKAAGIIWISFGILGLLNTVLSIGIATMGGSRGFQGPGCCGVLFAIGFLVVGVQTVNGTAKGTLGNGIGSIFFGLLWVGLAILSIGAAARFPGANRTVMLIMGGVMGLLALGLLVAGFLAIAGRDGYRQWRDANGMGVKRRRLTPEEEDYDDEPRRPRRSYDDDDRPRKPRHDENDD